MIRWVYLFFFLVILVIPQVITRDYDFIIEEHFETLGIMLVGVAAGTVFLWREKQFRRHMVDKRRYQQEASEVSKDLVNSYSYIGEINRQLEILKDISSGLPGGDDITPEKRRETFDTVLEAILVFARTENFSLRFIHCKSAELREEMGMGETAFDETVEDLLTHKQRIFQVGDHSVIRAAKTLRGYAAFILLDRKQVSDEDVEFLRAIASQALLLFVWGQGSLPERSAVNNG